MLFSISLIGLLKILPKTVHVSIYADDICFWTCSRSLYINKARLQKAINITARYLHLRGLHISPEKSAAMAFTKKHTDKYPIEIDGKEIPYVTQHTFLGVTLDRQLTWGPHVKRLKKKLSSFINIIRMISGTKWGCSVSALLALYNALFLGLLRYSLPAMHNISRTLLKELESIQAQALRTCLGLPKGTSNLGSLAEAQAISPAILRTQETLRAHLRHKSRTYKHHLTNIVTERPSSGFAQVIALLEDYIPTSFEAAVIPSYPPWRYPHLEIRTSVPGIASKKTMPTPVITQTVLEYINRTYASFRHVFTDGSTMTASSTLGAYIPSLDACIQARLSHVTSSTASELAAIRAAVARVGAESPSFWAIFVDSKTALLTLSTMKKCSPNLQLAQDILEATRQASCKGHQFIIQWIPGHSGITGNVIADRAARNAHESDITVSIPFSKSDANNLIRDIGQEIASSLWRNPQYHYSYLYNIDPKLRFRAPRGLPRAAETVLHRLRLNVAYTNSYLYKIGRAESSDCASCGVTHNIEHVLCECKDYSRERELMKTDLRLQNEQDVSIRTLLGPWISAAEGYKATKALLKFLAATRLQKKL
ncbi:uncharacterized protein LOC121837049 [Ixodes scapularis]|uniref:uncharacterized protein LOC121837049 n=1 Tax=Ixodes scapularis TaxID=6945 RepID=UPI001A9CEC09|nr:uncharacterized protein LOC121837049 [Ixodes scapularis]